MSWPSSVAASVRFASLKEYLLSNEVEHTSPGTFSVQCSFLDSVEHAFLVLVIDSLCIDSAGHSGHHSRKDVSIFINDNEASYEHKCGALVLFSSGF